MLDILTPPLFTKSGTAKTRTQAYHDGDWVGVFNLWIVARNPEPSIIYQQRGPDVSWAPGMLDVAAGGHLLSGEEIIGGLREVHEELGRHFSADQLTYLGRKLYVGLTANGQPKHNVVNIYMVEDHATLSDYTLQESEVYAVCRCPIKELLHVYNDESYMFTAQGLTAKGESIEIPVNKASFPVNYDDYQHKMVVLADRYFRGETGLLY